MTVPDPPAGRSTRQAQWPDPPFSAELLADLHAGHLTPDLAQHVRRHIADDPDAVRILEALDRTAADLARYRSDTALAEMPDSVDARLQHTLQEISQEAASSTTRPTATRRWGARQFVTAGLAAAAVIAALAIGIASLGSRDAGADLQATDADAGATPSVAPAIDTSPASLLTVLGDHSAMPFESTSALRRCTAANGIAADTPVVGSGKILVDNRPRAVILFATGVAGRFDALVVELDCDAGRPATVSRTTIGG